ncbi:O-antigen ligase [Paenarthrobacter nicotinovorans]|uniref:O-antigen ligase family protein n=1 Tax=Micrococcaceae TaxID=1268 RepID=UPI0008773BE0|nr:MULTISPECIES: O-antigen ligase family protein [Micrococcaceae]MDR6436344.1 O-antigen ligase [Paenarthrobacter nicotinovorans]SCZ57956.1 O-antigen ligase [Arthrobacter sp. UNCCL28]
MKISRTLPSLRRPSPPVLDDLAAGRSSAGPHVPLLLKFAAFGIFFFPSNMVLKPLGAVGTVPLLIALLLLAVWMCSVLFGLTNPLDTRHPGRMGFVLLWVGTCASYAAMYSGYTGGSESPARAAADRWLILLLASAGIILVTAEAVRTLNAAMALTRALLAGAAFCCVVAAVQFFFRVDPMQWLQMAMPGFTNNGGNTTFQIRGSLMRVSGSTFHSIEMAVICAMLLPLSIWRSLYDPRGKKWVHWTITALLVFAIASTVSRSGILGLLAGMAVFLPFLPRLARRWAFVAAPVIVAALFLGVPGLVGTLASSLTAGDSDPSITTRTNNYPRVAAMVQEHPLFGVGPGNYMPTNAIHILDNQYLNATVTIGLVGLVGLIAYLTFPGLSALLAARASRLPALRCLAGAIAAAGIVAAICSLTFDSMSFPVFALTYPFIVGLAGGTWNMVRQELGLDNNGAALESKNHSPENTKQLLPKEESWTP